MKAGVIVFPGSNCDRDVACALADATGQMPAMIWHRETSLPSLDLIVLPGGFSYGDYLRPGAMAAHSPIMTAVKARAAAGTPVLGICNGFQVLCEAGLLPGVLMRNASLRFICKEVFLRVEADESPFTARYAPGAVIRVPIAHNEGNYYADRQTIARLEGEGRIAFRYCAPDGTLSSEANPNGSISAIAGVFNETRRVLGLMPHPERAYDPTTGGTDGRPLFQSLVAALA